MKNNKKIKKEINIGKMSYFLIKKDLLTQASRYKKTSILYGIAMDCFKLMGINDFTKQEAF